MKGLTSLLRFVILVFLLLGFNSKNMAQSTELKIGDKVPSFSLENQKGENFSIDKILGKKNIVIYFYPKDETTVCTKEACSFRDSYEDFKELGCEVIGISSDDVESHKNFAENHNLPFILLSDTKQEVRKLFGVPSSMFGMLPGRYTYVVDKKGEVILVFNSALNAQKHIDEALNILKQ